MFLRKSKLIINSIAQILSDQQKIGKIRSVSYANSDVKFLLSAEKDNLVRLDYPLIKRFLELQSEVDQCNEPMFIVIAGSTGSGKSRVAHNLAKSIKAPVINMDSRQIYKEIYLSTDSLDKEGEYQIIDGVEYYLYRFVPLSTEWSWENHKVKVDSVVKSRKSDIYILVGGTGLYLDAFIYGYSAEDIDYRRKLELETCKLFDLQSKVHDMGIYLNKSELNNRRRLINIILRSSKSRAEQEVKKHLYVVIEAEPVDHEVRLLSRIDKMFEHDALYKEFLIANELIDLKQKKFIGLSEFVDLDYKKEYEKIKSDILLHTKQYIKKQDRWFKRVPPHLRDCIYRFKEIIV